MEQSLSNDLSGHFGYTAFTVRENNRYLLYAESFFPGEKINFKLKEISRSGDFVQLQSFQYASPEAFKPAGTVSYRDAGDYSCKLVSIIAQ